MSDADNLTDLTWLSSTLASDALEGAGALPLTIRPLAPEYRVAGRISVVRIGKDDNLDLRRALELGPQPGPILLVAGGAESTRACMGGLMAREARLRGFTAIVTDAPVRDAAEIRASGLLVWSRGLSPMAPARQGGGQVGEPVSFGSTAARAGDLLVADEDGVVVWSGELRDHLLARAQARKQSDDDRARALDARLAGQAK